MPIAPMFVQVGSWRAMLPLRVPLSKRLGAYCTARDPDVSFMAARRRPDLGPNGRAWSSPGQGWPKLESRKLGRTSAPRGTVRQPFRNCPITPEVARIACGNFQGRAGNNSLRQREGDSHNRLRGRRHQKCQMAFPPTHQPRPLHPDSQGGRRKLERIVPPGIRRGSSARPRAT